MFVQFFPFTNEKPEAERERVIAGFKPHAVMELGLLVSACPALPTAFHWQSVCRQGHAHILKFLCPARELRGMWLHHTGP